MIFDASLNVHAAVPPKPVTLKVLNQFVPSSGLTAIVILSAVTKPPIAESRKFNWFPTKLLVLMLFDVNTFVPFETE